MIYRLSRVPERRIFYVDVGSLPKNKAEHTVCSRFDEPIQKQLLVYDANTGEIRDDRKFMNMLEDYWFPCREGGGRHGSLHVDRANLGEMEDDVF